jgi:hypothetical protein
MAKSAPGPTGPHLPRHSDSNQTPNPKPGTSIISSHIQTSQDQLSLDSCHPQDRLVGPQPKGRRPKRFSRPGAPRRLPAGEPQSSSEGVGGRPACDSAPVPADRHPRRQPSGPSPRFLMGCA